MWQIKILILVFVGLIGQNRSGEVSECFHALLSAGFILYKSVEQAFVDHIKHKKILQLNDQMQVFFDPEPQNPQMNKLSQQLRVRFDKNSTKDQITGVDKVLQRFHLKFINRLFVGNNIQAQTSGGF